MGHGFDQSLRIGVARITKDLRPCSHLYDLAQIHHRHPVRDILDHGHVMTDEEIGHAHLAFQLGQQV